MLKADSYLDIHAKNHSPRTNQNLCDDFEEKQERQKQEPKLKHCRGVAERPLFFNFPHFDSAKMLPQCSR